MLEKTCVCCERNTKQEFIKTFFQQTVANNSQRSCVADEILAGFLQFYTVWANLEVKNDRLGKEKKKHAHCMYTHLKIAALGRGS